MANSFIQRYNLPATRITLPRLTEQSFVRRGEGTFVQFAGRPHPVGVRPSRSPGKVWRLEIPLAASEQYLASEIDWLLNEAYEAADARILFVPNPEKDDNIHPETVVEIHEWDVQREPGGIVRFRIEGQEVDG